MLFRSAEKQKQVTDKLFITRMYSFCPSLLDNYLGQLQAIYNTVVSTGVDTEHAHHAVLDPNLIIQRDTLHCEGLMAGTGAVEKY